MKALLISLPLCLCLAQIAAAKPVLPVFDPALFTPGAAIDNQTLQANRKRALDGEAGSIRSALGDADAAMHGAARTIEAQYAAPYVALQDPERADQEVLPI